MFWFCHVRVMSVKFLGSARSSRLTVADTFRWFSPVIQARLAYRNEDIVAMFEANLR